MGWKWLGIGTVIGLFILGLLYWLVPWVIEYRIVQRLGGYVVGIFSFWASYKICKQFNLE